MQNIMCMQNHIFTLPIALKAGILFLKGYMRVASMSDVPRMPSLCPIPYSEVINSNLRKRQPISSITHTAKENRMDV